MASVLYWLDTAASARGGGYTSCHYNCGWNLLSGISAFILFGIGLTALNYVWRERSFIGAVVAVCVCVCLVAGVSFVGPIVMVVGLASAVISLASWFFRTKKA
jgi:hypothetical protein